LSIPTLEMMAPIKIFGVGIEPTSTGGEPVAHHLPSLASRDAARLDYERIIQENG